MRRIASRQKQHCPKKGKKEEKKALDVFSPGQKGQKEDKNIFIQFGMFV